ncbi:MAG: tetratricopeptide repeat protein, partial [Brevinema sp.]
SSYIEINNLTKASSTLNNFQEEFPSSTLLSDFHSKLGDSYFTDKKFDQAIFHYQQIPKYTKNTDMISDALFRETWTYVEAKKPESVAKLQFFLDKYPSHDMVPSIMYKLSDLQQNEQLKYIILAKFPNSAEAESIRNILEKNYSSNSSLEELEIAIRNTSDKSLQSRYLYFLAQKLESENKGTEALSLFLDIHKLQDKKTGHQAAFKAANIYTKQGDHKKALRLYINIISQYDEKHTPKALDQIIIIYASLNDKENTEKFMKILKEQYPNSPEAKKWI